MNQSSTDLSKCHQAPVTVDGRGDFDDADKAVTQYYVCSKCKQPCDLYVPASTDFDGVGGLDKPSPEQTPVVAKSLTQAQEFVASIAKTDTALGGYLAMNPFVQQSLAYYFFQFANPLGYLESLTDLVATDKERK